jgi:Spy/CpxP family protein refolding chaperone
MTRRLVMRSWDKNKLALWVLLVLAVMILTALITIIYQRYHDSGSVMVEDTDRTGSEIASMRFSGRYFQDELDLTREQMLRFRDFNPLFRQQVRGINLRLSQLRQEMLREMSAGVSDTNRLNMLSDSIGALHSHLKKLTYRYYMDFKEMVDKSQQEKLKQLFNEMFATDTQPGRYGQRGQYGRGRGRQFNNQK